MVTCVILAGGKSSRMGTDKAFVLFKGKPLVAHVIDRLLPMRPSEIIIVTRNPEKFSKLPARAVTDVIPDQGPVGGLLTALTLAKQSQVALISCDMPFINASLLLALAGFVASGHIEAAVPRWKKQVQPLHAIYRREALEKVKAALAANERRLVEVVARLNTRYVDEAEYVKLEPKGKAFTSLNSPEELRAAEQDE